MHIKNLTSDMDDINICLYKPGDKVDWVPVGAGVFMVGRNDNHDWTPPSGEGLNAYHVKVFKSSLIDGLLCEQNNVPVAASIEVLGGKGTYQITNQ